MFGFLKDKLKKAISKFTKDVKEEVDEKVEEVKEEKKPEPKKETPKKVEQPKEKTAIKEENKKEAPKLEKPSKKETMAEEKKSHAESKKTEAKPISKDDKTKAIIKEAPKIVAEEKKPEIHVEKKHVEIIKESAHEIKETKKHEEHIKKISEEKTHHEIKKAEPKVIEEKKTEIKHEEENPEKHVEEEKIEVHHKNIAKEEPKIVEEKKGFFEKLFGKKEEPKVAETAKHKETRKTIEKIEEKEIKKEFETKAIEKEQEEAVEEKKGFFEKLSEVVTKKTLSESKFEELFFELEVAMLENNVAVEVIEKIKSDLKKELMSEKVSRVKTEVIVAESLKKSIDELFEVENIDLLKEARKKKPYVICFVGVNGSGKTTNLAKLANYLQKNGLSVVIAACDTFRAAAIQQIEEHANKLGIKLVKHDYGADAAAVAYDAIEHAKAKGKDVVLIDTAGRSHANQNLMDELEKVVRVSKPDLKIFVGDSLTGNDAVDQAKSFNERVGVDGIILSKVDVDEKGGAAISVSYTTQKPIMFIGTGQTYDDFEEFDKERIMRNLGF